MTTTIVGRGPSLLSLTRDDFPPGRVIALNASIVQVRRLNLPNPIYTMQKDGCRSHLWTDDEYQAPGPDHACPLEIQMVRPEGDETLIVSVRESLYCFNDWPRRIVIDVEAEFGLPWYTNGSNVRVDPDDSMTDDPHSGYRNAGVMADALAREHGTVIRWGAGVTA
jgi:hypothetical protein